jgi:hypothetical protein
MTIMFVENKTEAAPTVALEMNWKKTNGRIWIYLQEAQVGIEKSNCHLF